MKLKRILLFTLIFIFSALLAVLYSFNVDKEFKYGLDIAGGAQLTYVADISEIPLDEVGERLDTLKGVIENRINALGVSEPSIYVTKSNSVTNDNRLVVELPEVTDITEAQRRIGETPFLEFFLINNNNLEKTGLNGSHIKGAQFQFIQGAASIGNEPVVILTFDGEGRKIFSDLTRDYIGEQIAISLDGEIISAPVLLAHITEGVTQISGSFTAEEANSLARNLNLGALPVPIELDSVSTVDPSLGEVVISKSVFVFLLSLLFISIILLLSYKLSGLLASVSLLIYVITMIAVFKFIPVVLTTSGLAGFIMSLGFAVDANILIFERIKEELKENYVDASIKKGFKRAWQSIRDGNISSLIISILLFWFGTSLVKGFALTFSIGVLVSMITSILVTRTLLITFSNESKIFKKILI